MHEHMYTYVVGTFMAAHAHGCRDCTWSPLHPSPLGKQTVLFFFFSCSESQPHRLYSWWLMVASSSIPKLHIRAQWLGQTPLPTVLLARTQGKLHTSQKETVHCLLPAVSDYAPPLPQTQKTLFSTALVVLTAWNSSQACLALRQTGSLTRNRQNVPALGP